MHIDIHIVLDIYLWDPDPVVEIGFAKLIVTISKSTSCHSADTLRDNNVVITSKQCCDVVFI